MRSACLFLLVAAGSCATPSALARTCTFNVDSNDQMRFSVAAMKVATDCTQVVVNLRHTGTLSAKAMGHNWVLTRASDMQAVAMDGMRARFDDAYLMPGDKRVIAHTPLIGGGQSTSVRFAASQLQKGVPYSFFCSFPGHFGLMRGTLSLG